MLALLLRTAPFILIPALASANVPAPQTSFCVELKHTVQAVERREVAKLELATSRPNFGFQTACGVQGEGWFCHQALAPVALSFEVLTQQVANCLPQAKRLPSRWPGEAVFIDRSVRIRIQQSGAPQAQVGRIVTLSIEPTEHRK